MANLAVMGASVSTNPFNVIWQLLWVAYALTAAATVALVTAVLVVLPVLDARTAAKVCSRKPPLALREHVRHDNGVKVNLTRLRTDVVGQVLCSAHGDALAMQYWHGH